MDPDSLARYLCFEYVPSPRSIYQGIGKLEPGHYLHLRPNGDARRVRYWTLRWGLDRRDWPYADDLPLPPAGLDKDTDWIPVLLRTLRSAVKMRLVSEVPIGALLSGGVDSSAI